ncbi:MAG: hypothetical protein Q9222_000289 [Ikaeria aurantiellina]
MAIKARDQSCRVTGSAEAGETAHLIAVKLQDWFMDQGMDNHSDDAESLDSTGNQLLLRVDIHRAYDQFKWVIFPSADRYVYHALDSYELASLHHQRELRPIHGVSAFAQATFPKLRRFLGSRMYKYLLLVEEGSETPQPVKKLGNWCVDQFYPPLRPRSASPTKRESPTKEGSPSKKPRNAAACYNIRQTLDLSPAQANELLGKRSRPSSDTDDLQPMPPKRTHNNQLIPRYKRTLYLPTTTTITFTLSFKI